MTTDARRALPSVNALLEREGVRALLAHAPRPLVTDAIRTVLDAARRDAAATPAADAWDAAIAAEVARRERPSLVGVLNATGIVLHTNLARAPLAGAALEAIAQVAAGYANLEYDLEAGARGSRYVHCVGLLTELTGAEDALVVNNCAGALVLALAATAHGRASIISRGELIEIGGAFRVPDIMATAGTTLVEVGTTNRTRLADYERAITDATGALVKVHRSNFTVEGFVEEVTTSALAGLARARGLPLIEDFGSGLMLPLTALGLSGEPTAREVVAQGASLVLMSGDKLMGGPQAGIILGERALVQRLKAHPLARAFRVDKLTIAALGATLALYRDPARAMREIPVLCLLATPARELEARAKVLAAGLAAAGIAATVEPTEGAVGGGAFPTARLASFAVAIAGPAPAIEARLRAGRTPVVARIADDRVLLDLRAVPARDDATLLAMVRAAAGASA
jgi:L-seryl-tRNA(Ser) seleniumtransferase